MDYSPPLIPSKIIRYKRRIQIRDQAGENEKDKTNEDFVTVCTRSNEEAEPFGVRSSPAVDGMYPQRELDGSINMSSEDVVMDKLFQACDPQGKGKVKVSDLVEYLTTIVDMQLQEGKAVAGLLAIMDPKNTNAEIGSEAFHSGLRKWIEQMKSGHFMDMNMLSSSVDSTSFDAGQSEGLESFLDESSAEDRLSVSQLSSRVTDLQYLNRKVTEEIKESRAIIDSKEEELSKLSRDLQKAKSEIKRLSELTDLRHEAEAENEELREQMSTLNKKLDAERHRTHQTEQEKELLKAQLQRYKAQVDKLTSNLDLSQHQQGELKSLLAKNKEKISHLKVTCCNFDAQLAEKDEHIQQLQTCLRELTKINEDLKNQSQELRNQLIDTQQELLRSVLNETSSGVKLPSLREMAGEIEEDVEHPSIIIAEGLPSSIHNELQNLFNDSPNLPWPLSEKELKESVVTTPDLVSQVGHAVNVSSHSIDEETENSEESDLQRLNSSDAGESQLMKKKCTCDYHYDVSNEKLRLFVSLLKHFKDENQKLKQIVEHTCLSRKDDTKTLAACKEFRPSAQKETTFVKCEMINEELSGPMQCQAELVTAVKRLQSDNKRLLLEIDKLQRSNVNLSECLHKSELHICELDEEFEKTQSSLNIEKQRCAELEENLVNSTLARQLDLHDIWRLVQKDVETECEDFQEDVPNEGTSDQLKEKIKVEIEALRTRLQKREAALGSLKNNNLNLQLTLNYDELYQTPRCFNGRKWAPSSPLVDALTIDVFNGNLPMYNTNYTYPPPFVSCEDVDCYDCRAARLFLQNRFASSCPSILPTNVNNSWTPSQESKSEHEQQINTKDKHLETRTQSLEVTADANFCVTNTPKRKRSLYGSNRRQDFIKSSGRGVKEKTQHRSLQNQQLETKTTTNKDNQVNIDSNIETSVHHQTVSNKNAVNFVSTTNTLNSSIHDLTTDYNLHITGDLEPALGVRRSSFKLAVECNHLQSLFSSIPAQTFQSNKDDYSSIEELRRPSFHAAIEQGKGDFSTSNSFTRRKVVQIASPEISESRETIVQDFRQRFDNNENISNSELSEGITFYFDESDPVHFGEAYAGAGVFGTADRRCAVKTSTPFNSPTSLISSAMVSASKYSSTSSTIIPDDLSNNLSLGARSSQEKEDTNTNIKRGMELIQDRAEVSTSACVHARGDTSADMNQQTLNVKEGVGVQKVREDLGHPYPGRLIKTQESNPSDARHFSDESPSRKEGLPATSTTSLHSSTQSTLSSLLAVASPQTLNHGVPARAQKTPEGLAPPHTTRERSQAGIRRAAAGARNSDVTCVSEVKACRRKPVAPTSSPSSRCPLSEAGLPAQPVAQSQLSKIRESHLASKKREHMKARSMKLPELAEHSELETKPKPLAPTDATDSSSSLLPVNASMDMPQISVTDEDAEVPPAPSNEIVTPSLPEIFLMKLGLSVAKSGGDIGSIDQLSDKEIESKFISLSLAFKTDKNTLNQRVSIQERSRDLAEQNVDVEIQGLRCAVETLNELVTDAQLRALLQKIKLHINVLEQLATRVSSRAEMFGAVQQERRLCKAMEVMVMYTENLRRIREKEESELHEARKLISEKTGNCIAIDPDSSSNRRSLSVSGYSTVGRMSITKQQQPKFIINTMNDAGDFTDNSGMRRRSEVALPRIIGGIGSPSLTPTAVLESLPPFLGQANNNAMPQESQEGEDPKSRFQSAVASTSMQNVVTTTMRRGSMEKLSLSPTSFLGNTSPSTLSVNKDPSLGRGEREESRISKDEEAFRKGFEEGLKTKLSHELDELREQQNTISQSLEQVMDTVEQSQLEDTEYYSRPSRLEATLSLASIVGGHMLQGDWRSNKKIIRNLAGVFFVFLAIFVVFLCPPISTVDVRHVTKPPQ